MKGSNFSLRVLVAVIPAAIVWTLIDGLPSHTAHLDVLLALVIFVAGLLAPPLLPGAPLDRAGRLLQDAPMEDLVVGALGLGLGLILGAFLAFPLSHLPYPAGMWLPLLALVVVTALFTQVAISRRADVRTFLMTRSAPIAGPATEPEPPPRQRVLLDTSAIIDGRIADISATGFISGELVVPRFILDELQHIADSPDLLRRNRGRRGLDMLNRMSKDSTTPVSVLDLDAKDIAEVDGKLVQIAKRCGCSIITNDFNLNRVAELQGVLVLNVNQLANAVKPVVLPGEEMAVHIIQQGKEINQGVGYLDDGTMIVVEDGQRFLNRDVDIIVTRVLQTVAGRMIFAHPKAHGNGR
ncbi:MAG TPA: PIN domain-containing protein [Chloroflexota bacterium]|nr:PIN domain-containing protein [Chloroflexota bacterium]